VSAMLQRSASTLQCSHAMIRAPRVAPGFPEQSLETQYGIAKQKRANSASLVVLSRPHEVKDAVRPFAEQRASFSLIRIAPGHEVRLNTASPIAPQDRVRVPQTSAQPSVGWDHPAEPRKQKFLSAQSAGDAMDRVAPNLSPLRVPPASMVLIPCRRESLQTMHAREHSKRVTIRFSDPAVQPASPIPAIERLGGSPQVRLSTTRAPQTAKSVLDAPDRIVSTWVPDFKDVRFLGTAAGSNRSQTPSCVLPTCSTKADGCQLQRNSDEAFKWNGRIAARYEDPIAPSVEWIGRNRIVDPRISAKPSKSSLARPSLEVLLEARSGEGPSRLTSSKMLPARLRPKLPVVFSSSDSVGV
jgi:hypothetical protein